MSIENIESFIKKFPIYQYVFIKPDDIEHTEKVRQLCKRTCVQYGLSWSCPPAVGKIDKCRENCLEYSDLLVFSTLAEIKNDNEAATAEAQKENDKLTDIIRAEMEKQNYATYVVTSGRCQKCSKCTFPRNFCRYPDNMYPCVESQGIMISDFAEKYGMDYYMGSRLCLMFSFVYFKENEEQTHLAKEDNTK